MNVTLWAHSHCFAEVKLENNKEKTSTSFAVAHSSHQRPKKTVLLSGKARERGTTTKRHQRGLREEKPTRWRCAVWDGQSIMLEHIHMKDT